ncbi:MAG: N-acetylmuramoyl-L-alanine amidase [Chitinispirillaceae bacterium]|nr:N-acetylmuramoyl-L-alanine amidase [Chitinispirillaceae bacterium]
MRPPRFFSLLFMVSAVTLSGGAVREAGERNDTIAASHVAITVVTDSLGYSWEWERAFGRLTCVRQPDRLRFYEGNCFYYLNGSVEKLPEAPVRRGATLYLSRCLLERLFAPGDSMRSGPERTVLSSHRKTGVNILSVTAEKKRNGTLLSIVLADSLPFDVTYFFPNLTFNFFGGRVDTTSIKQKSRIGLVNSIFSIQFDVSAQVTALLSRDIEEPMIDYVQDTRTIMVSLKPQKIVQKPKKKASADSPGTTIIVLDPGHGGKDPGCIGASGVKEKDIVLPISLALRDMLQKKKGLTIYMTRETDVFIPLSDRTKFANDKKAHLFISIHADAIGGDAKRKQNTRGYKIYFLSHAKNEEDKLVAMRENAVIELEDQPQKYSNLQNVLIEMAGNEYLRESQDLCIMLDQKFNGTFGKKIPKLHRGVGQANFWVLNGAFMPSVLIETGFLSYKKEEKLLSDSAFQKEVAAAMSRAVIGFCEKYGTGL